MSNIIQGDSGTILEFTVKDDNGVVDISNTKNITFRLKKSGVYVEKEVVVVDGVNGLCQVALTSDDTNTSGSFIYQVTFEFVDGSVFSSDKMILPVSGKI